MTHPGIKRVVRHGNNKVIAYDTRGNIKLKGTYPEIKEALKPLVKTTTEYYIEDARTGLELLVKAETW